MCTCIVGLCIISQLVMCTFNGISRHQQLLLVSLRGLASSHDTHLVSTVMEDTAGHSLSWHVSFAILLCWFSWHGTNATYSGCCSLCEAPSLAGQQSLCKHHSTPWRQVTGSLYACAFRPLLPDSLCNWHHPCSDTTHTPDTNKLLVLVGSVVCFYSK